MDKLMLSISIRLNSIRGSVFRLLGMMTATRNRFQSSKGPMTESTLCYIISKRQGKTWVVSGKFKTLDNIIIWVGVGFGAMEK